MTHAVLDVGSNTIRLLVARLENGHVHPILDESEFVRLGREVDKTGELQADRMAAGVAAIARLAGLAREHGAPDLSAIATSAVRDAGNGQDFVDRVKQETGVEVRIISGEREADLTFRGASIGVDAGQGVVVSDLGGGSAEFVFATAIGIRWRRSEQLGSGRLTERFIAHDPPQPEELDMLREQVRQVLSTLPPAIAHAAVFTGGTASHVALLVGSDQRITTLDLAALRRVEAQLAGQSSAEIADGYSFRPERAQVLPAGAAALTSIAAFFDMESVIITRNGIREGALLAAAEDKVER